MIDIGDKVISFGVPLLTVAGLGFAIKKLPGLIEDNATKALEKLFQKGDAADDAFIVASMVWAEAKYGPGTGKVKADAVVSKIISLLPLKYKVFVTKKVKEKATQLFQESFDRLESVMKEAIKHEVK